MFPYPLIRSYEIILNIGKQKLISYFCYDLYIGQWAEGRQKFAINLQQEEYYQGRATLPWLQSLLMRWHQSPSEGGVDSSSLLETPLSDTAGAAAASFPWTPCEWPTRALGRRDPGRWVPQWLLLLRTSSSEIWSSSFWRRRWEPAAEPSSWSWLEGKDSGWRMSSGKTPLIHLRVSFVNSTFVTQGPRVSSHVGKRWWNQGTDLSQLVRGNKVSGDWIESDWK